ncbi:hypothetical protein DFH06DRAFT_141440 [Mycena polygramma]|nr:hypothetical protein DFH06DRAFT_141440 [Mycena polygramma]
MDPALDKVIHGDFPPTDLQSREIRPMLATSHAELVLQFVVQLDSTILAVSLILSELESQKSSRRKALVALRGALAPIRRIPPEILTDVFLLCRDNSMVSKTSSIADSREAPIVLGQVSSRWRSICHGTPLLWDNVRLISVLGMPKLPYIQTLLARSHDLPVFAQLVTPYGGMLRQCPVELAPEPALGVLMGLHSRLKTVTLEIPTANLLLPYNTHQLDDFPVLASLEIILADSDGEPDVASALKVFSKAPCLQRVSLLSHCIPRNSHSLVETLPWAQLTNLDLHMRITLRDARRILGLCQRLQTARISGCFWTADSVERTIQVPDLRTFYFDTDSLDADGAATFFEAFPFPSLRDLEISAGVFSSDILLNLHNRSQFELLVLREFRIPSNDLLELLCRLPTLRELTLRLCCMDTDFAKMFTVDHGSASHRLTLPRLQRLSVMDFSHLFEGTSAAAMAESLCLHRGRPTSAFPALESVFLSLQGPKFDSDVERRLAAACTTGMIFDECAGLRR